MARQEGIIQILCKVESFNFIVELNDTATARHIVGILPLQAQIRRWGDELYCGISAVDCPAENLTREVSVGDIGFCPCGNLFCVFFGPTPASVLEKPVAENPVVVIGRTLASPDELRSVREGSMVSLSVHGAFSAQQTPPAAIAAAPAASAAAASSGCGERKLSQSEIDALVQQLLAEKKKNQQ